MDKKNNPNRKTSNKKFGTNKILPNTNINSPPVKPKKHPKNSKRLTLMDNNGYKEFDNLYNSKEDKTKPDSPQFIFSLMFYYNSVVLYNGFLILGYRTIYICLPSISVLLDQDIDRENCLKFPNLYNKLLKGRDMNLKNFLWWVFKIIFHACTIMFGSIFLFKKFFIMIVTITFTALIFLELLNVYTEINKFHPFMVFYLLAMGIVYLLTLIIFKNLLDVTSIFKENVFFKILLVSALS